MIRIISIRYDTKETSMARAGLSYDDVAQAADRVAGRGERVTLRSVRAELGTGSLTTIGRHLEDYQGGKRRETASRVDATLELPERIVEAIQAEIEAQKQGALQEQSEELETLKADRDALTAEVERLSKEIEAAQAECYAQQGRAVELEKNVEIERNARIRTEEKVQLVREQLAVATAAAKEVEQLRAELKAEQEKRHHAELQNAKLQSESTPKPPAKTGTGGVKTPAGNKK